MSKMWDVLLFSRTTRRRESIGESWNVTSRSKEAERTCIDFGDGSSIRAVFLHNDFSAICLFFNLLSLGRFSPKTRGLPTAWVISAKGEPWWATFQKVKKIVTPGWQYVENAKNIWVYHGLSGSSIPQNPMVNHHFPWTCHFFWASIPHFLTHPSQLARPCWAMLSHAVDGLALDPKQGTKAGASRMAWLL